MFKPPVNFDSGVFTDAKKQEYYDYKAQYDILVQHGLTDQEADEFYLTKKNILAALDSIDLFDEEFFITDQDHGLDQAIADIEKLKNLCKKLT